MCFFDFGNIILYNDCMEIDEKNLEKILKNQREKYQEDLECRDKKLLDEMEEKFQRHVGILAEDFSSQLKGVADSVSGSNQRLDTAMEMVAKNTEDIETIKSDISVIKSDLKQKVDVDEFRSLERKVKYA